MWYVRSCVITKTIWLRLSMYKDIEERFNEQYTAHLSYWPHGFRSVFFYYESMGANNPHGVASLGP